MRTHWMAALVAGATMTALGARPAAAVRYCTDFNSDYLTRILTDGDDCGSYSCGFYEHDFSDAREECGDEVFKVKGPGNGPVLCDFCFWSECLTMRQNEMGIVALDDIGLPFDDPGFRDAALAAPSARVIFRGGASNPMQDNPPMTSTALLRQDLDYIFFLVFDHTLAEAMSDPSIPVWFSVIDANSDRYDHMISLTSRKNGKATVFAWEDLPGGGDNDLNDVVFTTRCLFLSEPARPKGPRSPASPASPGSPASTGVLGGAVDLTALPELTLSSE